MSGSQKFLSRNRAPRVQIEYDVELYGAEKKVQLPFVMGVLSDLSGKAEKPAVEDRKFLEIDADNFDERMRAMAPKAQFSVPNTLTGEGSLPVDLSFEKMSDFSPEAIAEKVGALAPLLEARRQLSDLMAYMDGKSGAEALIEKLLTSQDLLAALSGEQAGGDTAAADAALEALKAQMPAQLDAPDTTESTLSALAASAPADAAPESTIDDVLGALDAPEPEVAPDEQAAALDALRSAPVDAPEETGPGADDVLAQIDRSVPEDTKQDDNAGVLEGLRQANPVAREVADNTDDVLAGIEAVETDAPDDAADEGVLEGLRTSAPPPAPEPDRTDDVLSSLETPAEAAPDAPRMEDVLGSIDAPPEAEEDASAEDVLGTLEVPETVSDEESTDDVLATLEAPAVAAPDPDNTDDILAGLEPAETGPSPEDETDGSDEILRGIEAPAEPAGDATTADAVLATLDTVPETAEDDSPTDDILAGLDAPEDESQGESADDVLAGLEPAADAEEPEDATDDVLAGLDAPIVAEVESADDVLATLESAPEADEPEDTADDILAGLEEIADVAVEDSTDDVLASLDAAPEAAEADSADDVLAGLDTPETEAVEQHADDILAGLEEMPDAEVEDSAEDILASLDMPSGTAEPEDAPDDILAALDDMPDAVAQDSSADDVLASLEPAPEDREPDDATDDILGGLEEAPEVAVEDSTGDVLASLEAEPDVTEADSADDVLAGLDELEEEAQDSDADDILAGLEETPDATPEESADDILAGLDDPAIGGDEEDEADDILAGLDVPGEGRADDPDEILAALDIAVEERPETDPSDDALAGLEHLTDGDADSDEAGDSLEGLEDLAEDASGEPAEEIEETPGPDEYPTEGDDLDDLLAGLDGADDGAEKAGAEAPDMPGAAREDDGTGDNLDDLLADLDSPDEDGAGEDEPEDTPDLPEVAGKNDDIGDDLDTLLSGLDGDEAGDGQATAAEAADTPPAQSPFGTVSAPRPDRTGLHRPRFRMAILGDFTGRAARGLREVGAELAARPPIPLDVDTVEDLIEGFATTLSLPIGQDGAGIEVKLGGLDDLHPDELYENVEIFEALSGLRKQLSVGSMAEKAVERLKAWSETYATPVRLPKRSAGSSVPANLKLSDFQALIGDTSGALAQPGPADDLIARIVGPHIVKAPDEGAEAMKQAVDAALSSAMRLVLHHPDFQAVEAQWRSLDLLARRIETDSDLEIVLYDISAEELALDLAAQEDLAESGLFRLLTDVLDPEEGAGGFSALFGLYTFEETPPHAELLARVGQLAAHVDAPFFAAITPAYLETAKEDRHPLVAGAWDRLRAMPEAAYLGLASPRFLLRLPYGAKSEPIYEFEFEEFTAREGLSGMLWANPVVLVAILLAGTFKKDGKAMNLGSVMSLGDLPFHYVNDRYGDQVALPCTERNLTSDPAQHTLARGYMPVLWVKGRNEVRLGSFRSLAGDEIAGPWSGEAPPPTPAPEPPAPDIEMTIGAGGEGPDAPEGEPGGDEEASLDDLLAGFDDDAGADDADGGGEDEDMDPDLAALLEGL